MVHKNKVIMCWSYASFVIWVVSIWPKFIERNSILFNKEHKFFHISQNNFCPRILVKFFFCSTLTHLWTDLFISSTSGRCAVYMKCCMISKVIWSKKVDLLNSLNKYFPFFNPKYQNFEITIKDLDFNRLYLYWISTKKDKIYHLLTSLS